MRSEYLITQVHPHSITLLEATTTAYGGLGWVWGNRLTSYTGATILHELSQTSYVGLRSRDKNTVRRAAASQLGGSQEALKEIDTELQLEQVDVELFNLYAIRKLMINQEP